MAGTAVSHLVIFIASILIAGSVAGVLTDEVAQVSQSIEDQGLDLSQEIRTDIEVISDPGSSSCCFASGEVTILVKNTGSRTLPTDPETVDVLINGTYHTDVSMTVVDGTDWAPGNVVEITVSSVSLGSGDHRVKVIVQGDQEVLEFRE